VTDKPETANQESPDKADPLQNSPLLEFFYHDFEDPVFEKKIIFSRDIFRDGLLKNSGEYIEIRQRLLLDPVSWIRVFTFYIPEAADVLQVGKSLVFELEKLKAEADEMPKEFPGEISGDTFGTTYSKRVFLYSESGLEPWELTELEKLGKSLEWLITFRSGDYARGKPEEGKPWAFLSCDPKDRETLGLSLAEGLRRRACPLQRVGPMAGTGESMVGYMEKNLQEVRLCVLLVTPCLIESQMPFRDEFNATFSRERILSARLFLPIWIGVTKERVADFSPQLAEAFALIWPTANGKNEEEQKPDIELLLSRLHIQIKSMEGHHRFH
jgi:hypothetical protein